MIGLLEKARLWREEEGGRRLVAVEKAIAADRTPRTVLDKISHFALVYNSEDRLAAVLPILRQLPAPLFWKALKRVWSICDDTWSQVPELLEIMRKHGPARRGDDTELKVYRGCSIFRIRGISWTMDYSVAERFARGHRNIEVPYPVVARARINRSNIFMRVHDRGEHEVLVDPLALTAISAKQWRHGAPYPR